MKTDLMIMGSEDQQLSCMRDKQISRHESEITVLKTRADYKEDRIEELTSSMKDMSDKLDEIKDSVQLLTLQSAKDDANIDKRVTALENTVKVLKWVCVTAISSLGVVITVLAFAMTHLH